MIGGFNYETNAKKVCKYFRKIHCNATMRKRACWSEKSGSTDR